MHCQICTYLKNFFQGLARTLNKLCKAKSSSVPRVLCEIVRIKISAERICQSRSSSIHHVTNDISYSRFQVTIIVSLISINRSVRNDITALISKPAVFSRIMSSQNHKNVLGLFINLIIGAFLAQL